MKRVIFPLSAMTAFALSATGIAATPLSVQVKALNAKTNKLTREVAVLRHQLQKKNSKRTVVVKKAHMVVVSHTHPWPHFMTVTTTPFLGKATDFDGQDLLYNVSSNNEDLRLLKQKQVVINHLASQGYQLNRPVLQISGVVAGQAYSSSGFNTGTTNGINLASTEVDFNAMASSWASAFMSTNFNGSPISLGNREPNAQIYLGRAFATIGNLNRCPFYFTMGLMYVPFGRYANGMVTSPLTVSLARIRTPAALLGFSLNNGLFGSIYGYSGSQTSGGQPLLKQGGANLGLKRYFGSASTYSVGAGWVTNIADSQGQQNTGASTAMGQFGGFGVATATSSDNNLLIHPVEGIDAHGEVTFNRALSVAGEFIGAAERFASADMTYNGSGARPQAMHAEMDYLLPFFAKKYNTTLGVGYGHTWQALALNLPQNSYSVFLNTSIWRETGESIEFRHDTDYGRTTTATGRGGPTAITGSGRARNTITAQFGVYF